MQRLSAAGGRSESRGQRARARMPGPSCSPAASLAPYTRQIEDLARFLRGEEPVGLIPQEGGA